MDLLIPSLIDNRAESPRHIQSQLAALHRALGLPANADRLCAALRRTLTAAEAEAELALALDAVRHQYESVDVARAHEDEYAIAKGRSAPGRRVAVGLVVVRRGVGVYGIVAAVAAAMRGGCCVLVELPPSEGEEWRTALRDVLTGAGLDVNTFCVSEEQATDPELLRGAVVVDQAGDGCPVSLTRELVSSSRTRTIAVVDRTANVEAAARAIVRARFGFSGLSPYAPDLVLVNEYIKKEFFEECSRYATGMFAARTADGEAARDGETRKMVAATEERKEAISFGSEGFKLVEVLDRSTPLLKMKISGRYLPIATCSSLVDAIFSQEFENPLLAGYFFADLASAKYLSQYLPCHISTINHIPAQLLIGPAAPTAHAPDILYRYNPGMFTVPRPQFVAPATPPTTTLHAIEGLLDDREKSKGRPPNLQKLRVLATQPLKPTGQPATLVGIDHFLSGLLVGSGVVFAAVIPVLGWSGYLLGKRVWGWFGRRSI